MRQNGERLDVFVVHWNQPRECAAAVLALLDQGLPLRITVIDNDSALAAYEQLRASVDRDVELVRLRENKGWGAALNVVLREWMNSDGSPFCFIAAHDALPEPDCLRLLAAAARNDPKIGIASPQYHDAIVPRLSALRGVYYEVGTGFSNGAVQKVDVPHGTLFLVRRQCLAQIGLFDERYFAYGDEHDLGARAARSGWTVALVWGAIVTNPATHTPSAWRSYLFARNSLLLVHDCFGPFAACIRAILILLNTVRLMVSPEKGFVFSAEARWRAVVDYFAGRFGRPL